MISFIVFAIGTISLIGYHRSSNESIRERKVCVELIKQCERRIFSKETGQLVQSEQEYNELVNCINYLKEKLLKKYNVTYRSFYTEKSFQEVQYWYQKRHKRQL